MIEINIPSRGIVCLEYLVCDVNGTLAIDGDLITGVKDALTTLKDKLQIKLITANTHGRQDIIDKVLGLQAIRLHTGNEIDQKAAFVRDLGQQNVVAIGQGANDVGLLKEAVLGICILSAEGLAVSSLLAADILVPDILTAFELLQKPLRIVATLNTLNTLNTMNT